MEENVWKEDISVNPAQLAFLMLPAKQKYAIYSRGTGKSFIVGAEIDENVRTMPRGVTTLTQATYGQTLTKTLPSSFKMLEMLGYNKYDTNTHQGDYVVCRKPPEGWYLPYEHILSFEHCITFSNGHCLYLLSQDGNSRGPNADYNITDEALTIDKEQFDQEVAPTNRGNEHIFGRLSKNPVLKHHGNTFLSSMPYEPSQKWLLEPAKYYEQEKGVQLFETWNRVVKLQMQLINAKLDNDLALFREIWNECTRLRQSITPFVSQDGTLFMLASIFDNIANVGMSYIINQYKVMDRFTFMVEILNYIVDKIDHCYYNLDERHKYYNATNDTYIRDFAEDTDFDFSRLAEQHSLMDADCNPNEPLELAFDWGSAASFLEVAQESTFDWNTHQDISQTDYGRIIDNTINEFYVHNDGNDTMINTLVDQFCHYYRFHSCKVIHFYRDKYGDIRSASSKRTYNETAIRRLERAGWAVEQHAHRGIEPPQHDKYLLWASILTETDHRFPIKRFNASKCKHILISMGNTRVMTDSQGRFTKDKRSERNSSILPEEATHFGDAVDKRIWTKYGDLLKQNEYFVDARI